MCQVRSTAFTALSSELTGTGRFHRFLMFVPEEELSSIEVLTTSIPNTKQTNS